MSQNPNVNFQGSTINNARVVGSQGVNYTEQNESGIRLDNESTINMIRGNSGGVNISQMTINQQPQQPSTSQASRPQSSDRKNHSNSISKHRIRAGNIFTNTFHGMFPSYLLSILEKTLKEHARVVCGEIIHPIKLDLAINTVKLELSQRVPSMPSDDEGHYNKRDEVVKAWESVKGNIELKDLFTLAQNSAEKEAERFVTQEAKQDYINKNKNTVFVIGQAGMGKTTLAKTIINLVIEGQLLPECRFLFYIPFRAIDFLIESNFLDFVLRCFQSEWPHNVELDFVLLKKLSNDPNVLFIFDDLDEADTDYFFSKNTSLTCDLCDSYTPDIFIANILSGNIFANAKKLLTSRPRQFFELNKAYLSGCVVNILGLSVKSQAELCQQICKEKYDAVQDYLSRNPLIDASCYVPAKCIIIYGVLSDSFNSSLDHDIQSLTDIFVRALYYYSKSKQHVRKPEELQKLCHLAWNGFQARKIIFTESDISKVKISSETLETFLTTSSKDDEPLDNLLQGKKQSSFSHLIWHELFTAIHLILNVPSSEFQNHLSFFLESRWEVVASFVFGLCNRRVQRNLNDIFNIAVVDFDKKFQQLDNFVCKEMANLRKSFQTSTFLEVCNWIYQLNNREMTEKVAAFVPEQIWLDGKIHLTDLCSVGYLLQYAQSGFSIRFGESLSFTYNAIYRWLFQVSSKSNEVFCQNLIRELLKSAARQPDSSVDNLLHACRWLYDKSEDSNAKEMVQYFPQLVVLTKSPSFDEIKYLMYFIVQSTSSFNVHIKCNSPTIQIDELLDPDKVITLVAFLHFLQKPWQLQMNEIKIRSSTKVEHLLQVMRYMINKNSRRKVQIKFSPKEQAVECDLSGCGISSQGTQMLAFFLLRLPYRIDRLNLSGNKFGDAGVPFIMSCLDKIDKLYMTDCDITEEGVRVITEHIKNCSNLPKVLDFNYDKMNRSKVLCCGFDLLDNNGDFRNHDLTPVGVEALATAIKKLPQPIDRLNLSENEFGDAGVPFIMSCLDKIKKLYMTDCDITEEGVRVITEHIENCSNMPKVLEFNYDEMNRSKVLRCGLDQLDYGYFRHLDLTPVGWEALAAAINKLPKPMKWLNLRGNDLGDDEASHISTCLSKIEKLDIGECKISASGIKSISDAISKLPEPMKELDLSFNNLGDYGASHISTCLSKIEELDISQCKISAFGIKSISDAISKLPEPTQHQDADAKPPMEKRRLPNNDLQQIAVTTTSKTMQERQQQPNFTQSTSSSSAMVTESPTVSTTGQSESQGQNKGFVRKEIKETPQEYIPYRARAAIGKNGGRVQFGGCEIIIPPKALKDYVYFTFTLRYEFNQENENKILATPVLDCAPAEKFQKDVTITLPTCYSLKGSSSDKYQLKTKKRDYSGPNDQTILNYGHFAIKSFDEFKMEISEADAASKRLLLKFYKGFHPGLPTIVWEILDNFETKNEQKQQFEVRITNGQDLTLQMKNENGCVIASQHIENKELFQTSCIKLMYSHTVQEGMRDMFEYNILDKKDIITSGQFSLESLDCRDKREDSDHGDDSSSCSDDGDDSDNDKANGFSQSHMDEDLQDGCDDTKQKGRRDQNDESMSMDDNGNQQMGASRGQKTNGGSADKSNGDGDKKSSSEDKNKELCVSIDQTDNYSVNKERSKVLVISNWQFEPSNIWDALPSHKEDEKTIVNLFKNSFNCTVESARNKNAKEIRRRVKRFTQNSAHCNFCAVFIFSHGTQDKECPEREALIVGSDGKLFPISNVINYFSCATKLSGIPKLLFIDCCRGPKEEQEKMRSPHCAVHPVNSEGKGSRYKKEEFVAHLLLVYATKPGYVSWDISPSFATLIEKVFSEHADKEHVLDLMTMVNAEMQRRETPQLADIRTFLLRKLWLKQRDAFQIKGS